MLGAWVESCGFAVEVICNDDSTQIVLGCRWFNVVNQISFDGSADGDANARKGSKRVCKPDRKERSRVSGGVREGDGSRISLPCESRIRKLFLGRIDY